MDLCIHARVLQEPIGAGRNRRVTRLPELPLSATQATQFIEELTAALPQSGDLRGRVE